MANLGNEPVAARKVSFIGDDELLLVWLLQVALIAVHDLGVHLQLRNQTSGQRDDPKGIRDTERTENIYPQR